jgi:hypothetical protein
MLSRTTWFAPVLLEGKNINSLGCNMVVHLRMQTVATGEMKLR